MMRRLSLVTIVPIGIALLSAIAEAQSPPSYVTKAVEAADRPSADTALDAGRSPAAIAVYGRVKRSDNVIELIDGGGYFTRIISRIVGPRGHVYAILTEALMAKQPAKGDDVKEIASNPAYGNVTVLIQPADAPKAPAPIDVAWAWDVYHDLHNPGGLYEGDADAFNRAVFAALKPGGTFLVVDHAGVVGTGFAQTASLHRIDPEAEKNEILKAGFFFDGQSDMLHRADEDHSAHWAEKDDQVIFRFRKPR